jgi:trehalose-phosphatase
MSRRLFDALDEIAARLDEGRHLLLGLEFDGTLVPAAEHPDWVVLPARTRGHLAALAAADGVSVAVVSGRDRANLQAHVDVPGVICVGNHGLEIGGPGLYFVEPTADMFRAALQELAADLTERLRAVPGALVEEKGLTLAVHYRRVPEARWEEVRRLVDAALADASHPFLLRRGRRAWEVRPRVYWDRNEALAWLRQQLGEEGALTVYLGDDLADEGAPLAAPAGATVKVGESLTTATLYHLGGPAEVQAFLGWVVERVGGKQVGASR